MVNHTGHMRLDYKYSWPDVCKNVIKRAKIPLEQQADFTDWFLKREKVGYNFDYFMVRRLYNIYRNMERENKDHFILIIGKEGDGKSTFALQLLAFMFPDKFTLDYMPHGIDDYKKLLANNQFFGILVDEGGTELHSRESLTKKNIDYSKLFLLQRVKQAFVVINAQNIRILDSIMKEHRMATMIYIRKVGSYRCITGKGMEVVKEVLTDRKTKNTPILKIKIPTGTFWDGYWSKPFPKTINKEAYDKRKLDYLNLFLQPSSKKKADSESN